MKRTLIKEINQKIGEEVLVKGWVHNQRKMGKLIFLDLRDRTGICQVIFLPHNKGLLEKAKSLGVEYVLAVKGKVNKKPQAEDEVEIEALELEVITKAETPPFEINEENLQKEEVREDVRLKYRYLDLRRQKMQQNIRLRHKVVKFIREYLYQKDFLEIDTPILAKSTPEGARDYLVPSRRYPGKFFALPQSPQQYKQLLMVAGFEKYFQIAPCFRDEDARKDRSPGEFYQLDLEMSFVEQEDILNITEDLFVRLVKSVCPDKKITQIPFPRLSWQEVIDKYNTDKPDLRENKKDPNELAFAWILDWPLFEPEMEEGHYAPAHHMFTAPKPEDLDLLEKSPAQVKSLQHDIVLNGFEIGGGSIRIHQPEVQEKIFELIGFDDEDKHNFAYLLEAFKYGVPPHGGIAPGIDRLLMILAGADNIKEVIAFPKSDQALELMTGSPAGVKSKQLKELHLKIDKK